MAERTTDLPGRWRVAIAASVFALFVALCAADPWQQLERRGFDALSVTAAPGRSAVPISIVAIDEASFAAVGRQWPWPRSHYAKLIDQLSKSGAFVIALDLLLSEPSTEAEDRALAEAIARAGNVVIASHMAYQETARARLWMRVDPIDRFKSAGALHGLAHVEPDNDTVVRNMPQGADVFWRQVLKKANQVSPGLVPETELAEGAMVRYVGPDHTFPFVSFYQAMQADSHLPADAFRDQIVIVGRDLKASPDARAGVPDVFATPFTATTRWLSPGVELHANFLETAILDNAIRPAPPLWSMGLVAAVVALCAFLLRRWRPLAGALVVAAVTVAVAALDYVLFVRMNVWLPAAAAVLAGAAVYLGFGGLAFLTERRRRAEIRSAFSLYVSPEVVDHVMAHPDRLKLGGERREVTLLFTDLKGFTTLSERLGAEEVAKILNLHFTGATAIIKRNGGTVNRFMGDAVMAMWGAPVNDPQQAIHAARAACEMQQDIARLREELKAEGLPEIAMRIGIHSCTAVVGNLGAADRFEYTAIGDGVNLASRLEGVNKLYGTGILMSGETASRLEGGVKVRPVDRVIVKGKTEPVEIFTPCEDDAVVELTTHAMAAYRARRWDEAEALWHEVARKLPGDGVAHLYLERIVRCRTLAAEEPWEAAVELEKL